MIKYVIKGNRWFAKTYGNTYHKVYITDAKTNKLIYESNITYGYDDQYKQTAFSWLIEQGLFKKCNLHNHELIRKQIFFNVSDVSREKDL